MPTSVLAATTVPTVDASALWDSIAGPVLTAFTTVVAPGIAGLLVAFIVFRLIQNQVKKNTKGA